MRHQVMKHRFFAMPRFLPALLFFALPALLRCLAAADTAIKPPLFEVHAVTDVAYRDPYEGEDPKKPRNKLDLYLPKGQKDFPVLFFVHGGAWRTGDKHYFGLYSNLGMYLAKQGIGAVI